MVLMRNANLAKKNAIKKGTRRKGKRFWIKKKNIMQKSAMERALPTKHKKNNQQTARLLKNKLEWSTQPFECRYAALFYFVRRCIARYLIINRAVFSAEVCKKNVKPWCHCKWLQPQQKLVSRFPTAGRALTDRYPAANHILRTWFEYADIRLIIAF